MLSLFVRFAHIFEHKQYYYKLGKRVIHEYKDSSFEVKYQLLDVSERHIWGGIGSLTDDVFSTDINEFLDELYEVIHDELRVVWKALGNQWDEVNSFTP